MNIIEGNNCCVCCGTIIPEGYQVCLRCRDNNGQVHILTGNAQKVREKRRLRKSQNLNPPKLGEIEQQFIDKIRFLSIKPRQKNNGGLKWELEK
jgi:hypothetical protein